MDRRARNSFQTLQGKSKQSNRANARSDSRTLINNRRIRNSNRSRKRNKEGTQSLAFLSKKLKDAQKKYSPYDRELLAIYTAIKHF